MEMQANGVEVLRNAYMLLEGIKHTGFSGIDSNVERAMISIKLALFDLGEEEILENVNR
jgi:hypothetical protein